MRLSCLAPFHPLTILFLIGIRKDKSFFPTIDKKSLDVIAFSNLKKGLKKGIIMKLLIANRGEIAIRIMRAAAELNIQTVAICSEDDTQSLHVARADESKTLSGTGSLAYLDMEQILSIAKERECRMIHPGYGFLSENAVFTEKCEAAGLVFVGPTPETLCLLGNKSSARAMAERCGVPVLKGSSGSTTLEQVREFLLSLGQSGAIMIKAVTGGGGRGMRVITSLDELEEAYTRCSSEALQAFGNGDVYVEEYKQRARHIEVQIVGDGTGNICHLGERECSIQRQHQKLIEIAPCPGLSQELRHRIITDAVRMAKELKYRSIGTFEFLVNSNIDQKDAGYAFIEANPRLQVEHTVTEEVMDVDLVKTQLKLAKGDGLKELGLSNENGPKPQGYAIQVRVNMETVDASGSICPSSGALSAFDIPSGRGVRVDTYGYTGFRTNPNFDSLLAKVIGFSSSMDFSDTVKKTIRALSEFKIEGLNTNISLLKNILSHTLFLENKIYTRFVDDFIKELSVINEDQKQKLYHEKLPEFKGVGAKLDETDPLAVLKYEKTGTSMSMDAAFIDPGLDFSSSLPQSENSTVIKSVMQGTVVSIDVQENDVVNKRQQILVMSAMKMEHVIVAEAGGLLRQILVEEGDTVLEGQPLVIIEKQDGLEVETGDLKEIDLDTIRPDLAEVKNRHHVLQDDARPDVVARRKERGQRTARQNVDDLCDKDTFVEYGSLAIAAQRSRRSVEELIERTPADGLIAGVGTVNGDMFKEEDARCVVMAYDYSVLAGTQGMQNHRKKDRLFELAEKWRIPVVFFTEGGGGRPGDTDMPVVAGLDCLAFHLFGRLSGLVPLVGINAGRCFAGNAALLGCSDVIIATRNSNVGMGGPAMIEGGGLGVFRSEEVGPIQVQVPNGVVDIAVEDEAEAVMMAKKYLSYFQGSIDQWNCADQRRLRSIIPENRLRIYDIRQVIDILADTDSVLELRRHFGPGMVTSLIRIEGRPLGLIANNPKHLSGAIDTTAADKAARFMQICDAFDIPILFLCDTPGIMVGPEAEKTALVRHCCRLFVIGSNLTVPFFTIVLRKSYGLGAQAMAGGSHKAPIFTVSWPTGEFGAMGLEGAVKLGFRRELAAIEDPEKRKESFDQMVEMAYQHGKALNTASHFEIDDVIDPVDSRHIISRSLKSLPSPEPRRHKKRPCIDTW